MDSTRQASAMHFKSAKIASVATTQDDMAQINQYALAPLTAESIFAFKVSMAANDIDRDYEVFPRKTLRKLADLFVGKTVVKDHDHRSDNQIARIYATELMDGTRTSRTKKGEPYAELIAKCYMVKTSTNADLISEIQAGIRKEVSLGCRIGKAVCSICGTDNVKTYCVHFAGKDYEGETCYFSLEDPTDAYELSFVAIPAQQNAGTVKSYGEKPCSIADMEAKQKAVKEAEEAEAAKAAKEAEQEQAEQEQAADIGESESESFELASKSVGQGEDDESRLTVNQHAQEVTSYPIIVQQDFSQIVNLVSELNDIKAKLADIWAMMTEKSSSEDEGEMAAPDAALTHAEDIASAQLAEAPQESVEASGEESGGVENAPPGAENPQQVESPLPSDAPVAQDCTSRLTVNQDAQECTSRLIVNQQEQKTPENEQTAAGEADDSAAPEQVAPGQSSKSEETAEETASSTEEHPHQEPAEEANASEAADVAEEPAPVAESSAEQVVDADSEKQAADQDLAIAEEQLREQELKEKKAAARLRALQLAISLRQRS